MAGGRDLCFRGFLVLRYDYIIMSFGYSSLAIASGQLAQRALDSVGLGVPQRPDDCLTIASLPLVGRPSERTRSLIRIVQAPEDREFLTHVEYGNAMFRGER